MVNPFHSSAKAGERRSLVKTLWIVVVLFALPAHAAEPTPLSAGVGISAIGPEVFTSYGRFVAGYVIDGPAADQIRIGYSTPLATVSQSFRRGEITSTTLSRGWPLSWHRLTVCPFALAGYNWQTKAYLGGAGISVSVKLR